MKYSLKLATFLVLLLSVFLVFSAKLYCEEDEQLETLTEDESEYVDDADYGEGTQIEADTIEDENPYSRARVIKVLNEVKKDTEYSAGSLEQRTQLLNVFITKGPHQGEYIQAEYELNYGFGGKYRTIPLSEGDEVFLFLEENDEGVLEKAYVAEIVRDKYLLYLLIGFVLILILVGRFKGLKAIISLTLTVFAVVKILLPAILKGWDPVFVSVAICVGVICISLLIISGFNKKTLSAIIGTAGGVIAAGVIALIIGTMAKLTGLGDEEAQMLMHIPDNIQFDFRGLLFSGIIIGTMGATMDVGMSIASAMHEIKENSPKISTVALIRAGMNIGRDTMATMANTLILAYAGGSLHLMLMFSAYKIPFSYLINWDMIASEVLRAIAGSIGIIFAIPITALASAFIEEYVNKDKINIVISN